MALNNPTTNDRIPEQNRDCGIEQDWAGDDQDWWDWYLTLAANDQVPTELVDGPGLPDVEAATDEQVERELAEPYDLDPAAVEAFAREAFVRLPGVLSPAVTQRFAERDVAVESGPFAVGDVSFHSALCFHTAGPNLTTQPRRALATTYFADGARVVESPTLISGTWREFLPGVEPGGLAASELNPVVGRRG